MSDGKFYVFYSRIPNSTVLYPDGVAAGFVGGRYTTQDAGRAAFLQNEINNGNQYLYVDPDKLQLTAAELDPMAELKARIIAEYEAQRIAGDKNSDKGTSDQGKLNVADTSSIGAAAADSDSGVVASTPGIKLSLSK